MSYPNKAKAIRKLLDEILSNPNFKQYRPITYKGPEIKSNKILAIDSNINDAFTEDSIEYQKEQGRDYLDIFINKVYQLGYGDGYDEANKMNKDWEKILKALKAKLPKKQ